MRFTLLYIILLSISLSCNSFHNGNNQDIIIREADSLYNMSFLTKNIEPLIKSKELFETITIDSLENYKNTRLTAIYFTLGEDSIAITRLANVENTYFKNRTKKRVYSLALKAFSLYRAHQYNKAKDSINEAINILDNFIPEPPKDYKKINVLDFSYEHPEEFEAIGLKLFLKTQIHDADLDSVYNEFEYLGPRLISEFKNTYPTKLHYRFALSGRKDFTTFLFEELDKIEDIEYE